MADIDISGSTDGTTRNNVPDYKFEVTVRWVTRAGLPRTETRTAYLLPLINWLITTHPKEARRLLTEFVGRVAMLYVGAKFPEEEG